MHDLQEYIIPYTISQAVSLIILFLAWKKPKWARIGLSILFLYASIYNLFIGLNKPDEYLGFAELALPVYRDFILGWFSHNNHIMIPLIAIGQLAVAIGILLRNTVAKIAFIGIIVFLLGIAPLMVGSAFPFSVTVSLGVILILRKGKLNYIWKKNY